MNDDELSRLLRSEVPEPGPGYWEEIDRRLEASRFGSVEGDQADTAEAAEAADENSGHLVDTDADVIRLRDMNNLTATRPRRYSLPVIPLAVAASVLVAVLGLVAVRNSSLFESADRVDAAGDGTPGAGLVPGVDEVAERTCYRAEVEDGQASDFYAYVDRTGDTALVAVMNQTGRLSWSPTEFSVSQGSVDTAGNFDGQSQTLLSTLASPVQMSITDTSLALDDAVTIPSVPCASLNAEASEGEPGPYLPAIDDAVSQMLGSFAGPESGVELLPADSPSWWAAALAGPLELHRIPSNDQNQTLGSMEPLPQMLGTGRTATADGTNWIQIATGNGMVAWVPASDLLASSWPDNCYRSEAGDTVAALAFDVDSGVGGSLITYDPSEPFPAVSRFFGSAVAEEMSADGEATTTYATERVSNGTFLEEEWIVGPDRASFNGEAYLLTDCVNVTANLIDVTLYEG